MSKAERVLRWFGWGLLVGAFPIYVSFLRRAPNTGSWGVLSKGDLLVLVASGAAVALGEIALADGVHRMMKTVLGVPLLMVVLGCACTFTLAQDPASTDSLVYLSPHRVSVFSLWFTGITLLFGGFTMAVTTDKA